MNTLVHQDTWLTPSSKHKNETTKQHDDVVVMATNLLGELLLQFDDFVLHSSVELLEVVD